MLPPEISIADYQALRTQPNPPILLDVREPWEHQTAAIPGAVLLPMSEFTGRAHAELDPDQAYVVHCHHGARSLSVAMWMRREGFDHTQSLAGGIDEWSRTIDPSIPRY